MSEQPVGVFDSGVGGLSVLREIRHLLPAESLLYVADSGFVPYGEKPPELIIERSCWIADFLLSRGAKALVLACNTATAAAVGELRARYGVPIVGMEPAVKPATLATQTGVVGVLATTGTLRSARFAALLDRFAGSVKVVTQPCPGLVECIERGELDSDYLTQLLLGYTQPLLEAGCDTLILGCTHYPFLKPVLQRLLPGHIRLIDTGAAVARQLRNQLQRFDLLAQGPARPEQFWSNGDIQQLQQVLPILWGESAPAVQALER